MGVYMILDYIKVIIPFKVSYLKGNLTSVYKYVNCFYPNKPYVLHFQGDFIFARFPKEI